MVWVNGAYYEDGKGNYAGNCLGNLKKFLEFMREHTIYNREITREECEQYMQDNDKVEELEW